MVTLLPVNSGSDLLSEEASRLLGGELKAPRPLVFRVFGMVRKRLPGILSNVLFSTLSGL